jgi:hypothetical protein
MVEQIIICPKCGERIPASKALTQQIETELRDAFEAQATKREKEAQLAFEKRLATDTARLEKQARKNAEEAAAAELSKLQQQVTEGQKREKAAQASFEGRLAEEKTRLTKQSQKAIEEAAKKIEAEHQKRELELEKKLSDAKRQAADLKRKLEQGSQQLQGEVAQLDLGEQLQKAFHDDKIEPIPKGRRGADVLQKVYASRGGQYCGSILWESKDTKDWSEGWLAKLRSDQRRVKAELAVLVSVELPRNVTHFAQVDGVWVTGFPLALCLATALRTNLIQVAGLKQSSKGNHEKKMELLYEYLSSTEFRQRIEAIGESFRSMQDDLEKERTTMERHWAKRETQIRLVVQNVSGMYGDMQGIVGPSLPNIRRLELPGSREL